MSREKCRNLTRPGYKIVPFSRHEGSGNESRVEAPGATHAAEEGGVEKWRKEGEEKRQGLRCAGECWLQLCHIDAWKKWLVRLGGGNVP